MRILIVCGAGASSTFVAQRLRGAAERAHLAWECAAGTADDAARGDLDLVLVGPHLADRMPELRRIAAAPLVPLPADAFADRDGSRTLDLARAALAATDSPLTATSEGTS